MVTVYILQLVCTTESSTHLCNRGVALQALSQGLASFNTQIIGACVDLFYIVVMKSKQRSVHIKESHIRSAMRSRKATNIQKCVVSVQRKRVMKQTSAKRKHSEVVAL